MRKTGALGGKDGNFEYEIRTFNGDDLRASQQRSAVAGMMNVAFPRDPNFVISNATSRIPYLPDSSAKYTLESCRCWVIALLGQSDQTEQTVSTVMHYAPVNAKDTSTIFAGIAKNALRVFKDATVESTRKILVAGGLYPVASLIDASSVLISCFSAAYQNEYAKAAATTSKLLEDAIGTSPVFAPPKFVIDGESDLYCLTAQNLVIVEQNNFACAADFSPFRGFDIKEQLGLWLESLQRSECNKTKNGS